MYRGGSRGRVQGVRTPPETICGFLIQLVFCKKKTMWFIGVEVEQETSAPPPKKNPGSAPDVNAYIVNSLMKACGVDQTSISLFKMTYYKGRDLEVQRFPKPQSKLDFNLDRQSLTSKSNLDRSFGNLSTFRSLPQWIILNRQMLFSIYAIMLS